VLRDMSREFDGLYATSVAFDPTRALAGARSCCRSSYPFGRAPTDGAAGLQPALSLFVGLEMDEPIWATTVFTKNRDRLLNQDVDAAFSATSSTGRVS